MFHHEGGVDIGDVDAKALKLEVPVDSALPSQATIAEKLLINVAKNKKAYVTLNEKKNHNNTSNNCC